MHIKIMIAIGFLHLGCTMTKIDYKTTEYQNSTYKLKSNEIPDSVFQMVNLKNLSIQGMDCDYRLHEDIGNDTTKCWVIREIPSKITNLSNLEILRLNVNAIRKIPIELTELKKLKELYLTDNNGLSDIENVTKWKIWKVYP